MNCEIATHDFCVRRGDTFTQRQIMLKENGEPMDLNGAVVKMVIKAGKGGTEVANFNPEPTQGGVINLPHWKVELKPYNYVYDLEITKDGYTFTYMEGNFNVIQDV